MIYKIIYYLSKHYFTKFVLLFLTDFSMYRPKVKNLVLRNYTVFF